MTGPSCDRSAAPGQEPYGWNRFKFYRLNLPVKNLPVENLPVDNLPVKNFTGSKNNQLVKKETIWFAAHVYTTNIRIEKWD